MQQKIIHFLKNSPTYVSGEDMSAQLKVSRAAIWKYIDQLRQEGYLITAVPHLGYKLESLPDKLIDAEITDKLKTKFIGQHVRSFESIDSTMDEAFRLGMDNAPEGTIVCAETQTKGRGRLGRKWLSPKGKGIYFSLILRPQFAPSQIPVLTLMSGIALAEAIKKTAGVKTLIKWPNDILVGNKKLAGILTELRAEMDQIKMVVIGIGLNVNTSADQLLPHATSLKAITARNFNRVQLLQQILVSLEYWYQQLNKCGVNTIIKQWKKSCGTLNQRVEVITPKGVIEGVAFDLGSDGSLLIKLDNGKIHKHLAGDVTAIR